MSGSMQFYLAIAIFVLTYVAIMSEKIPRTICAMFGGGAMLYCGYVRRMKPSNSSLTSIQSVFCAA